MLGNRLVGFGSGLLFLSVMMGTGIAHETDIQVDNCVCDQACYTDEVSNLNCSYGSAKFSSSGLPNQSHGLMVGITASNQQFPTTHNHQTTIGLSPVEASNSTATVAGPIGVAVNGISLFNPDTQGPIVAGTGRPPSTLDIGELDECGGHAGRGDDYHYHIAPKCLIEELGETHVDVEKRPIGFAMDGYPILALGWFDQNNDVESLLDDCRGVHDSNDQYFYNVRNEGNWDIFSCFSGVQQQGFGRDSWDQRIDQYGSEIVGVPVGFTVSNYQVLVEDAQTCHVMTGVMGQEQLLRTDGSVDRISNVSGTLFYCNSQCYGQFFEANAVSGINGRVMYHERPTSGCPKFLELNSLSLFEAYEGARQINGKRSAPAPS